jgi:nitrite reductase (cytochrome c-552)
MKGLGYMGLGAVAAVAAFLAAPLLLRQAKPPAPRGASLEGRFPVHAEAWKRPAREEPRWREKRGHAYSLKDRDESFPDDPRWKRLFAGLPKLRPVPGGCLACHGAIPRRGFGWLEATPYYEARREVEQPLGCVDCHDEKTVALRLSRPGFPLAPRSHPELRARVCGQCHAEYYFEPGSMRVAYPWSRGLKLDEIEAYYDAAGHRDYQHAGTGAALLKAQHPQFEMWSQGVHARSGVTCADCHMPLTRQGAVRITDHRARRPLENVERACLPCHSSPAEEMKARVKAIQDRTTALLDRALAALVELLDEGPAAGRFQRRAQFRADFVAADGSQGFHAPQEALRLLAESIDYARQGQAAVRR